MDKIDPVVFENRSELGRKLTADRYYSRYRKSAVIAWVFFILIGALGAHRFYLGYWRTGLAILIGWIVISVFSALIFPGSVGNFLELAWLIFMVFELVFLIVLVPQKNKDIKAKIYQQAGLD